MGDRGNIIVKDGYHNDKGEGWNSKVYLYAHWGGYRLPQTVQRTLRRQLRWQDGPYLTRMLFGQMIADGTNGSAEAIGEETLGELGYGISSVLGDNEHLFVVVDVEHQKVRFTQDDSDEAPPRSEWTFKEYIELSDADIAAVYGEL